MLGGPLGGALDVSTGTSSTSAVRSARRPACATRGLGSVAMRQAASSRSMYMPPPTRAASADA